MVPDDDFQWKKAGAIPFQWEIRPGVPKLPNDEDEDDDEEDNKQLHFNSRQPQSAVSDEDEDDGDKRCPVSHFNLKPTPITRTSSVTLPSSHRRKPGPFWSTPTESSQSCKGLDSPPPTTTINSRKLESVSYSPPTTTTTTTINSGKLESVSSGRSSLIHSFSMFRQNWSKRSSVFHSKSGKSDLRHKLDKEDFGSSVSSSSPSLSASTPRKSDNSFAPPPMFRNNWVKKSSLSKKLTAGKLNSERELGFICDSPPLSSSSLKSSSSSPSSSFSFY